MLCLKCTRSPSDTIRRERAAPDRLLAALQRRHLPLDQAVQQAATLAANPLFKVGQEG